MDGSGRRRPDGPYGDVRALLRLETGLRLLAERRGRLATSGAEGRRLPSIRAYAAAARIHRNTAAAVYRDLERFGLVRCVRGAGSFAIEGAPALDPGVAPRCSSPGLRDVLTAELGRAMLGAADRGVAAEEPDGNPLLVPLDETPPRGGRVYPLGPDERSVRALAALPRGSVVRLVSESRRLGRLVRATLAALRRSDVGLERLSAAEAEARGDLSDVGLVLIDALELRRHGTRGARPVFLPLSLGSGIRLEAPAGRG